MSLARTKRCATARRSIEAHGKSSAEMRRKTS